MSIKRIQIIIIGMFSLLLFIPHLQVIAVDNPVTVENVDNLTKEYSEVNTDLIKCFNIENMSYDLPCVNKYIKKRLAKTQKAKNPKKAVRKLKKKLKKDMRTIRLYAKKNAIQKRIVKRRLSNRLVKELLLKLEKISSERLETILKKIETINEKLGNSSMDDEKKQRILDVLAELEELILDELDNRGEGNDDTTEESMINDIIENSDK